MKKNWFWGVVSVIFISWIGNTIYFESKQLKEPVILNTYIDVPSSENTSFTLLYITNKNEVVELDSLLVDGYTYSNERNYFPWFGEPSAQSYKQEFTHHFLKEALFTLSEDDIKRLHESIQTDNVLARFTNGQVIPLKVDRLNFKPNKPQDIEFANMSGGSYNNTTEREIIYIKDAITMNAFELPKAIQQNIDIKIMLWKDTNKGSSKEQEVSMQNWTDIDAPLYTDVNWPLQIEVGDTVGLFFHTKDDIDDVKPIALMQDWTGVNAHGKSIRHGISIQVDPIFSQKQVNTVVKKARGEEK
ncbi:hypothetical protein MHH81_18200 [Psychrobacillus sp. FSL H8-0484]|uniref:hypothetical protein n=1 Tax=Psychrobacillus sp. FSL H8-0484 TaxID=2921390 RepID=UPI0030F64564